MLYPKKTKSIIKKESAIFNKLPSYPLIPYTKDNYQNALSFLFLKWHERAAENPYSKAPYDLSYACKFCSIFACQLFGGSLYGNHDHQFCVLENGSIVDFSKDSEFTKSLTNPYIHDEIFWMSPDHKDSLVSTTNRIAKWLEEFHGAELIPPKISNHAVEKSMTEFLMNSTEPNF